MTASPDPSLYPATYQISFWKGFRILLVPIALLALSQVGRAAHFGAFNLWFLAVLLVIVTVSLGSFVFARVTLYPDRIERQSWFGKRTMRRADVAELVVRGTLKTPMLTSRINGEVPFPLPKTVKTDVAWDAWMTVIAEAGPATGL